MDQLDKIKIGITEFPFDATHISVYEKAFLTESIGIRGLPTDVPTGRHMTVVDLRFLLTNTKAANDFASVIAQFRACPFLPVRNDILRILISKYDPTYTIPDSDRSRTFIKDNVSSRIQEVTTAYKQRMADLNKLIQDIITTYYKVYKPQVSFAIFNGSIFSDIANTLLSKSNIEEVRKYLFDITHDSPGLGFQIFNAITSEESKSSIFKLQNLKSMIDSYGSAIKEIDRLERPDTETRVNIEKPPEDINIQLAYQSIEWGTHPSLKFGLMARLSCIVFNHSPYMDHIRYVSDSTTDGRYPVATYDLNECSLFTKGLLPRFLLGSDKHAVVTNPSSLDGDTMRSFNACLQLGEILPSTSIKHNIYKYEAKEVQFNESDLEIIKSKGLQVEGYNVFRRRRKVNTNWNGGITTENGVKHEIKLDSEDRYLAQVSCSITNTPAIIPLQGSQHYTLQFMSRPKGSIKLEFILPNITEENSKALEFHTTIKNLNNHTKTVYNLNSENEKYRNLYPLLLDNPIANMGGLYLFNIEDMSTQNLEGQPGTVSLTVSMQEQIVAPVSYEDQDNKIVAVTNVSENPLTEKLELVLSFIADPLQDPRIPASTRLAALGLKSELLQSLSKYILNPEVWYQYCVKHLPYGSFDRINPEHDGALIKQYTYRLKQFQNLALKLEDRGNANSPSIFANIRKVTGLEDKLPIGSHTDYCEKIGSPSNAISFGDHIATRVAYPNVSPLGLLYAAMDVIATLHMEQSNKSIFDWTTHKSWFTMKEAGKLSGEDDPLEPYAFLTENLGEGLADFVTQVVALDSNIQFVNPNIYSETEVTVTPGIIVNASGMWKGFREWFTNWGDSKTPNIDTGTPIHLLELFYQQVHSNNQKTRASVGLLTDYFRQEITSYGLQDVEADELDRACVLAAETASVIICNTKELSEEDIREIIIASITHTMAPVASRIGLGVAYGGSEALIILYENALAEKAAAAAAATAKFVAEASKAAKIYVIQTELDALVRSTTPATPAELKRIEKLTLDLIAIEQPAAETTAVGVVDKTKSWFSRTMDTIRGSNKSTTVWSKLLRFPVTAGRFVTITVPVGIVSISGKYLLSVPTTLGGTKFGAMAASKLVGLGAVAPAVAGTAKVVSRLARPVALILGPIFRELRSQPIAQMSVAIKDGLQSYMNSMIVDMLVHNHIPGKVAISKLADSIATVRFKDEIPFLALEQAYYKILAITNQDKSSDNLTNQFTAYPDMYLPTYKEVMDSLHMTSITRSKPAIQKYVVKIQDLIRSVSSFPGIASITAGINKNCEILRTVDSQTDADTYFKLIRIGISTLAIKLMSTDSNISTQSRNMRTVLDLNKTVSSLNLVLFKKGNAGIIEYIMPSYIEKELESPIQEENPYHDLVRKVRNISHVVDPMFFILRETVPLNAAITSDDTIANPEMINPKVINDVRLTKEGTSRKIPAVKLDKNKIDEEEQDLKLPLYTLEGQENKVTIGFAEDKNGQSHINNIPRIVDEEISRTDLRAVTQDTFIKNYTYNIRRKEVKWQKSQADLNRAFPTYIVLFSRVFENTRIESHLLADQYVYRNILNLDIRSHKLEGHLATFQMYNPMGMFENNVLEFIPRTGLEKPGIEGEHLASHEIENKVRYSEFNIQPGTWIEIRHGYSSNIEELHTVFTGKIAEVGEGDVVTVIAQGHEHELMNATTRTLSTGFFTGTQYYDFCAQLLKDAPAFGRPYTIQQKDEYDVHRDTHRDELVSNAKNWLPANASLLNSLLESRLNASSSLENIWTGNEGRMLLDKLFNRNFDISGITNLEALNEISRYIHNTVAFPLPMDARATMFVGPPDHIYKYTNKFNNDLERLAKQDNVGMLIRSKVISTTLNKAYQTEIDNKDVYKPIRRFILNYKSDIYLDSVGEGTRRDIVKPISLYKHLTTLAGDTNISNIFSTVISPEELEHTLGLKSSYRVGRREVTYLCSLLNTDAGNDLNTKLTTKGMSILDIVDNMDIKNIDYLAKIDIEVGYEIIFKYLKLGIFEDGTTLSPASIEFLESNVPLLYEYVNSKNTLRSMGSILTAPIEFADMKTHSNLSAMLFKCFYICLAYRLIKDNKDIEGNTPITSAALLTRKDFVSRTPPGYRPFRETHYISSFDIIRNEIECTVAELANEVHVHVPPVSNDGSLRNVADMVYGVFGDGFIGGKDEIASFSLYQEPSQKYVRRVIEPNARTVDNQLSVAWRDLAEAMKPMYRGQLVIMGKKAIKPYDWIYLNDPFNRLYGYFEVEEVVHSISADKGWITTITPHAITHYGAYREEMWIKLTRFGFTTVETVINLMLMGKALRVLSTNAVDYFTKDLALKQFGSNILTAALPLSGYMVANEILLGSPSSILSSDWARLLTDNTSKIPLYTCNGLGVELQDMDKDLTDRVAEKGAQYLSKIKVNVPLNTTPPKYFSYERPVTISPLTKGTKPWVAGLDGINEFTGDVDDFVFGFIPDKQGLLRTRYTDVTLGIHKTGQDISIGYRRVKDLFDGYKFRFFNQ